MNTKVSDSPDWLDSIKWLAVAGLVVGGVYANSIYAAVPFLQKVGVGIAITVVVLLVAYSTRKGRAIWSLAREARIELRKVVWPTTTEAIQTTAIVVVVVILVAALLALIDWLLGLGVQGVIG